MADEIPLCNVIRIEYRPQMVHGQRWRALIGPDAERGQWAIGPTPDIAIDYLRRLLAELSWPWDPTWTDRL